MRQNSSLIFVLCDGITNPVFPSQVAQPLQRQKEKEPCRSIILISFERRKQLASKQHNIINQLRAQGISVIIWQRPPFLGRFALWPSQKKLKQWLSKHKQAYSIIARGPLAGAITYHACNRSECNSITLQVRGLLAQEYAYSTNTYSKYNPKRLWHCIRYKQLYALEQYVYTHNLFHPHITFEVVSPELKEYLHTEYGTNRDHIIIAHQDHPQPIPHTTRKTWRKNIRTKLSIAKNTTVYCYNGSIKAWQCPEKVLTFFKNKYIKNPQILLLILTPQPTVFKQLLYSWNIPKTAYRLQTVEHTYIYQYLAAADIGLIFRENHPINWVSRPTKILEYQAVGLPVIHNNTIAWLTKNNANKKMDIATSYVQETT